jgi:hypothetical protein
MPFSMRVVNTAAHFGACLAEEVIPAEPSATVAGCCFASLDHGGVPSSATSSRVAASPRRSAIQQEPPIPRRQKGEGGASSLQASKTVREEFIMKPAISATIMGFILAAFGVLSADAQDLKAMLLKPANGWALEWSNPESGNRGVTEAVFVERGERIVAKINIVDEGSVPAAVRICERDVTLTSATISFNSCRDTGLVLAFDLGDAAYPLKSMKRSDNGYAYKGKAK